MNAFRKFKSIFHLNNFFLINSKVKVRLHCTASDTKPEGQVYTEHNQVKSFFKFWEKSFKNHGIPEPKESIEHILSYNLGSTKVSDVYKNFETVLSLEKAQEINRMCFLRLKRMPIQYIIKEWDFRDLTLKMRPPVFIPRPETEQLVDIIAEENKYREKMNILEICCGSGAISLALLKMLPQAKVIAVDASQEACDLTKENAILHKFEDRIEVVQAWIDEHNLLKNIEEKFDIIVSNPPYVPAKDMENLAPEIKDFEDLTALDGGLDGLKVIRNILKLSVNKLETKGNLYLEVDTSHPKMIEEIIWKFYINKLKFVKSYQDFSKKDRFVKICKHKSQYTYLI